MIALPMLAESAGSSPLNGGQLTALAITLAIVAAVMIAIRVLGQFLAASHPEAERPAAAIAAPPAPAPAPAGEGPIPPEVIAVIAAAAATIFEKPHRIVSIAPSAAPSVESLMQQWSVEGRRAIYSSHRLR